MHETGPFSIPEMRDFVPLKLRPWIVILFVLIFQVSGGIYLAAVGDMVGSTALLQEDIMMTGYAMMVGMSLTFTVMFRLKFRFPTKTALLTCSSVLIVANIICMHTTSLPVLVATSLVAGFFRMWGVFSCNTIIQLWITPKRDLSVWFCFIYLQVQGAIQLSGLMTVYTAHWANWTYMHWLITMLLGIMMILTLWMFRNFRTMPKLPLFGIDWFGASLWAAFWLCTLFVLVYGEHYDWYDSEHIQVATVAALLILFLNLWRASFIRHPYIELKTWSYKVVYIPFLLYFVVDILLSPSHLFEHIFMESILDFDHLHVISLNWIILLGVIAGAAFSFFTFAKRKWKYKTMTVIAFCCITFYLMFFYFFIDYNLPKETLYLPLFVRAFGYELIAICFITPLGKIPVFPHFAQSLSVQAFVSAVSGSLVGTTVLSQWFEKVMQKNAMLLSAPMDSVNTLASRIPMGELYGAVQQQALMVSMKELFGWLTIGSLFCLLLFIVKEGTADARHSLHPRFRSIRRYIKHELRIRHLLPILPQSGEIQIHSRQSEALQARQ